MYSDKNNKTTRRDRLRLFRRGLELHALPLGSITLGGKLYPVADILSAIDADIARSDASEKGRAAWFELVAEERASHDALDPILYLARQWVRVHIGESEAQRATLADFDMAPRKQRAPSPKTQVAAHEKALETRKLLCTKGTRQREAAKAAAAALATAVPTPPPATK
jgi:hypothetical protein